MVEVQNDERAVQRARYMTLETIDRSAMILRSPCHHRQRDTGGQPVQDHRSCTTPCTRSNSGRSRGSEPSFGTRFMRMMHAVPWRRTREGLVKSTAMTADEFTYSQCDNAYFRRRNALGDASIHDVLHGLAVAQPGASLRSGLWFKGVPFHDSLQDRQPQERAFQNRWRKWPRPPSRPSATSIRSCASADCEAMSRCSTAVATSLVVEHLLQKRWPRRRPCR